MNAALTIARRHWKPVVALNAGILAVTVGLALTWPRAWTATAQLILPNQTVSLDASLGPLGQLSDRGNGFSQEVNPPKIQAAILTSQDVMQRVWLLDPEHERFTRLEQFSKFFKVKPADQSTVIGLEVTGSSPEIAKKRAENLLSAYQQRLNELRRNDAVLRERFSREELERSAAKLRAAQLALADFKEKSGLVNFDTQTRSLSDAIGNLTGALTEARAASAAANIKMQVLTARLGLDPDRAIASLKLGSNADYQAIRTRLAQLEAQLAEARGLYTEKNTRVRALVEERRVLLASLEEKLKAALPGSSAGVDPDLGASPAQDGRAQLIVQLLSAESEAQGQARQAAEFERRLDQLTGRLGSFGSKQGRLLELQRQYDIAEGVYKGLVAQIQQTKVNAFNTYPNVQILDAPQVDSKPTSPKLSLIALGGGLACLLGSLGLGLYLENRNPLLAPQDLERVELPVLARLPRLKGSPLELPEDNPLTVEFQRLALALSLLPLDGRRLLVTSPTVGEGKTTLVAGLGRALAALGHRVLLVDGDLRRTQLSRNFLAHPRAGSYERVALGDRLDLLAAAPREGRVLEYFASGEFDRLLDRCEQSGRYDFIVIDSPPVSLTSEASLLAARIRNIVFVVREGVSNRTTVIDSLEMLTRQNARVVGLAINGAEDRSDGYRYGRYPSALTP